MAPANSAGDTVFLTGGTGFIGRMVLRKLLLSGAHVVMAIRGRRGQGAADRLAAMWEDEALRCLPRDNVLPVEGNLLDPEFFHLPAVREVEGRITRIVHVAASVNMDESLETALTNNLLPGIRLYRWAHRCPLCTHVVITAFVSPPSEAPIYESPCPPIKGVEVYKLTDFAALPSWEELRDYHFTTYTFSKAALENYLAYLHLQTPDRFHLTFVRPSIVSVALADPVPGWNTSLDALNGVIGLYACGLLSGKLQMNRPARLNVVPVDYVADCLLAAAYARGAGPVGYVHATATEAQQVYVEALGVVVMARGNALYTSPWRQPRMRYTINEGRLSWAKFQLVDILPFTLASLVGSNRRRKRLKKMLYLLRSVYSTLISFYGVNVFNFHSASPPLFQVEDYVEVVADGVFETLVARGLIKRRADPTSDAAKDACLNFPAFFPLTFRRG